MENEVEREREIKGSIIRGIVHCNSSFQIILREKKKKGKEKARAKCGKFWFS